MSRSQVNAWRSVAPTSRMFSFACVLADMAWALAFLLPHNVVAGVTLFAADHRFAYLAHAAPEWMWGCAMIGLAFIQATGWWIGLPSVRCLGMVLGAILWGKIVYCMYLVDPTIHGVLVNTGALIFGVVVVIQAVSAYILWFLVRAEFMRGRQLKREASFLSNVW